MQTFGHQIISRLAPELNWMSYTIIAVNPVANNPVPRSFCFIFMTPVNNGILLVLMQEDLFELRQVSENLLIA